MCHSTVIERFISTYTSCKETSWLWICYYISWTVDCSAESIEVSTSIVEIELSEFESEDSAMLNASIASLRMFFRWFSTSAAAIFDRLGLIESKISREPSSCFLRSGFWEPSVWWLLIVLVRTCLIWLIVDLDAFEVGSRLMVSIRSSDFFNCCLVSTFSGRGTSFGPSTFRLWSAIRPVPYFKNDFWPL